MIAILRTQVRTTKRKLTSAWPAPTSMQRKVRVRSSFVRSENAAKDAVNLRDIPVSQVDDVMEKEAHGGCALAASLTARFISSF